MQLSIRRDKLLEALHNDRGNGWVDQEEVNERG